MASGAIEVNLDDYLCQAKNPECTISQTKEGWPLLTFKDGDEETAFTVHGPLVVEHEAEET